MQLVEIVEDAGYSAKSLDRPGLQRVLRQGDVEAVVVAKLDRLTRSVRDLGQLLDEHFDQLTARGYRSRAGTVFASAQIMRMCAA